MNTLKKLTCLTLALSLAACNEKVSPELQGASSSTTTSGGGSVVTPDEFYFRLVDNTDTMLNFKVHKTGAGNANVDCEISNTTGLSSDLYRADPATYDITCFYEAEELSLGFNGLSFAVEASANTCEYVGYGPYSFYDRMPGSSTQTLYEITCPEENPPLQADIDSVVGANYDGIPCGGMRNFDVTPLGSFSSPESDTNLCAFNYTPSQGPNCDVGTITINTTNVTMTDTDNDGNVDTPVPTVSSRTVTCGGTIKACLDGPLLSENVNGTNGIMVGPTVTNTAYSKTYSYASVFTTYYSTRKFVNYRRDLASTNIEYGNSNRNGGTTDLTNSYMSAFGDPLYKYDFDPDLMMMYSNNKRMDGTTLVTSTHRANAAVLNGFTYNLPFAAEPYIGLGSFKTNPFYTLYCFDNAFDVKARIRMVVRDWDRVFSTSATDTSFARISDVDLLPPFARQDIPYTDEVTGDPDSWNAFDDRVDWDDFIDMERDDAGVTYDPSITVWRTYPTGSYTEAATNGFFNPSWFPAEKP